VVRTVPSPPRQAEQRMGWIIRGLDCHSECLEQFYGVELCSLGLVGQSDPCGVGWSQYVNVCGTKRYCVGWCGSECHSVYTGGCQSSRHREVAGQSALLLPPLLLGWEGECRSRWGVARWDPSLQEERSSVNWGEHRTPFFVISLP
jgi:hypothetical protein